MMVGVCRRVSRGQGQEACTVYIPLCSYVCMFMFACRNISWLNVRLFFWMRIKKKSVWWRVPLRVLCPRCRCCFCFFETMMCDCTPTMSDTLRPSRERWGSVYICFYLFIFVPDHPWSTRGPPVVHGVVYPLCFSELLVTSYAQRQ